MQTSEAMLAMLKKQSGAGLNEKRKVFLLPQKIKQMLLKDYGQNALPVNSPAQLQNFGKTYLFAQNANIITVLEAKNILKYCLMIMNTRNCSPMLFQKIFSAL